MARLPPAGTARPDADEQRADRFEAMLEQRFSPEARQAFAREVAEHDRRRGEGGTDPDRLRAGIVYHGEVPDQVRRILGDWLPLLVLFAERQGLVLREPYQAVAFHTPAAFRAEQGAIPSGTKLPASAFHHDAANRRYTVRVVLPERTQTLQSLLSVVRAVLTRLYGDIYLREEVRPLEPYREDASGADAGSAEVTAGPAEKLSLLAEAEPVPAALDAAVAEEARRIGVHPRRQADQARKSLLQTLQEAQAAEALTDEQLALVDAAFEEVLEGLRGDVPAAVAEAAGAVETLNRQLTFLPPEDEPHHVRLRAEQPVALLRAAQVRLAFVVEAMDAVAEAFAALEAGRSDPLLEERLEGYRTELERGGLARAYLVPATRLSEDLEAQRQAFPLEVHGIIADWPGDEAPAKRFARVSRRLENALHQRVYNALTYLRHWARLAESGGDARMRESEAYRQARSLAANFRFRRSLLAALLARVGVVLDLAESAGSHPADGGRGSGARFPFEGFRQAWGSFVAHALTAAFFREEVPVRGFDPDAYWAGIDERLRTQAGHGEPQARLLFLLRRLHAGGAGLPELVALLREGTGTFRFAVGQALRAPEGDVAPDEALAHLETLADTVLAAHRERQRHAITPGQAG